MCVWQMKKFIIRRAGCAYYKLDEMNLTWVHTPRLFNVYPDLLVDPADGKYKADQLIQWLGDNKACKKVIN